MKGFSEYEILYFVSRICFTENYCSLFQPAGGRTWLHNTLHALSRCTVRIIIKVKFCGMAGAVSFF